MLPVSSLRFPYVRQNHSHSSTSVVWNGPMNRNKRLTVRTVGSRKVDGSERCSVESRRQQLTREVSPFILVTWLLVWMGFGSTCWRTELNSMSSSSLDDNHQLFLYEFSQHIWYVVHNTRHDKVVNIYFLHG